MCVCVSRLAYRVQQLSGVPRAIYAAGVRISFDFTLIVVALIISISQGQINAHGNCGPRGPPLSLSSLVTNGDLLRRREDS